jgi:hypothetical protein
VATNAKVNGLFVGIVRKYSNKTIKRLTTTAFNHLQLKRIPPQPQFIAFEPSLNSYIQGYDRRILVRDARKIWQNKNFCIFTAKDFERLIGYDLCMGASRQKTYGPRPVRYYDDSSDIGISNLSIPQVKSEDSNSQLSTMEHISNKKSTIKNFLTGVLYCVPRTKNRKIYKELIYNHNMKFKDWLKILSIAGVIFSAKQATASTSLRGRVYNQSDSMPITLTNTRTGQKDSTKVGRLAPNEYVFSNSWTWQVGDTAKIVLRDTTNNKKDSTFAIATYQNLFDWMPTLCLGGWGAQIRYAKGSQEIMNSLTSDSAYAKICTDNTLYGKFKIRDLPYYIRSYAVCFDLTAMNPVPSPGTQATITVRSDSFAGSITGTINNILWDACVLADSLNLTSQPQPTNITITPTAWPDTVDVDTSLQRSAKFENKTDLERKVGTAQSNIKGNIQSKNISLEPYHFNGDETTAVFSDWTPQPVDTGEAIINYTFVGDTNITKSETTFVRYKDINTVSVSAPETLEVGKPESLEVRLKNEGNVRPDSSNINITMLPYYSDNAKVSLAPGQDTTITFVYTPTIDDIGNRKIKAVTTTPGDQNSSNDAESTYVTVISQQPPTPGWHQKANMPTQIPGKYVKDGGSLVSIVNDADGDTIFAFRGNKSNEFYLYSTLNNTWDEKDSMDFGRKPTDTTKINKKRIDKGSALAYDGLNTIYAIKGNTNELWEYDIASDSWNFKRFIDSVKKFKKGSTIAFQDNKLFILAGGQKTTDNNFFAYDTATNLIDTLTSAPLGPFTKKWKDGSSMVSSGENIYALKGGDKYNAFWIYNKNSDNWNELESIPQVHPQIGRKTKVGDGGAIAINKEDSLIYAIKGKGKQDFWQYDISTGIWSYLDTIPRLNQNKKSVPKGGAALAATNDTVYLLKGNKLNEFWSYVPIPLPGTKALSKSSDSEVRTIATMQSEQNGLIHKSIKVTSKPEFRVYNSLGQEIKTFYANEEDVHNIQLNGLSRGIYFIKSPDVNLKTEKIVIVK